MSELNLRGFSQESCALISDMQGYGWTFRNSNHGAVGRAPDGKATVSVSRKLPRSNKQAAYGAFKRWLRATYPEAIDLAEEYITERGEADAVAETNPVVGAVLARRAVIRTGKLLDAITRKTPPPSPPPENGSTAVAQISQTQPMRSKDNMVRALQRTWSTGRIDYACAGQGCTFASRSARSVAQHYGATHTRDFISHITVANNGSHIPAVDTPPAAVVVDVDTVEPLEAVEAVEAEAEAESAGLELDIDAAAAAAGAEVMGPALMLQAVQRLVSRPLLEHIETLAAEVAAQSLEMDRLVQERDSAQDALRKISQDLDALRSLVASIGQPTS